MALQISIRHHGQNVTYNVTIQEEQVYTLCRKSKQTNDSGEYIPEKLLIRRKGKIWISDLEDNRELVDTLIAEISQFVFTNYNAA
jgi:hypothetical protein